MAGGGVKVNVDFNRLELTNKRIMEAAALTLLRMMGQRMEKGLGSDGRPMHYSGKGPNLGAYSLRWAQQRAGLKRQKPRSRKPKRGAFSSLSSIGRRTGFGSVGGRDINRRTLTFTGDMKSARGVKHVTKTHALIGWQAGPDAIKASGNEDRHPWVKPTKSERDRLRRTLKKQVIDHVVSQLEAQRRR